MPTVPGTSTGTAQAIIGLLAQDRARTQGNREAKNAQAQLLVNGILGGVNSAVGIGELVSGIVNARDRLALDQQEADRRVMADAQAAMQARYGRESELARTQIAAGVQREGFAARSRDAAESKRQAILAALASDPNMTAAVLGAMRPEDRLAIETAYSNAIANPDLYPEFLAARARALRPAATAASVGVKNINDLDPTQVEDTAKALIGEGRGGEAEDIIPAHMLPELRKRLGESRNNFGSRGLRFIDQNLGTNLSEPTEEERQYASSIGGEIPEAEVGAEQLGLPASVNLLAQPPLPTPFLPVKAFNKGKDIFDSLHPRERAKYLLKGARSTLQDMRLGPGFDAGTTAAEAALQSLIRGD